MKSAAQTATSQGNAGHECMRTIDRAFHASTYRPARTPSPRFGHPPLLLGVQIGAITVSTDTVQQVCHSSNLQLQKSAPCTVIHGTQGSQVQILYHKLVQMVLILCTKVQKFERKRNGWPFPAVT